MAFFHQLFNRSAEQLEAWMATREEIIEKEEDTEGEGAEALIKKHEDFTRALKIQEEKVGNLKANADRLIEADHYDSPAIAERIAAVLARCVVMYHCLRTDTFCKITEDIGIN